MDDDSMVLFNKADNSRLKLSELIWNMMGESDSFELMFPEDIPRESMTLAMKIIAEDYTREDILGSELGLLHACRYLQGRRIMKEVVPIVLGGDSSLGIKLWYALSLDEDMFNIVTNKTKKITYSNSPTRLIDVTLGFHHFIPIDHSIILGIASMDRMDDLVRSINGMTPLYAEDLGVSVLTYIEIDFGKEDGYELWKSKFPHTINVMLMFFSDREVKLSDVTSEQDIHNNTVRYIIDDDVIITQFFADVVELTGSLHASSRMGEIGYSIILGHSSSSKILRFEVKEC